MLSTAQVSRCFGRLLFGLAICLLSAGMSRGQQQDAPADGGSVDRFELLSLRGKVVFVGEALERLHGASVVPEAKQRTLALETADGELHPLLEDVRGRAFRRDKRLREFEVELLVRRYPGSPFIQIIKTYRIDDGEKFILDYWCDICSIAMYELKACDCCQGDIDLRLRKVEDESP